MLIETPKASAKAKSEDTTSRKGMYGVCVCSFKRTQLDWGRGTCLQKEVGGGGMAFSTTLAHAVPLWVPREHCVIKPKTTSV